MASAIRASASIALTPAQFCSPKDWDAIQPLLTQHYRDEGKSLYDVRLILARHGFRPTLAALKKRITKWELERNLKEPDMLYALGVAFQRDAQDKKTAFLIRGRVVLLREVKRYFRRKGVRNLRSLVNDAAVATPTTRIEFFTPEPSVTAEGVRAGALDTTSVSSTKRIRSRALATMTHVHRVIQQPTELNRLNLLLYLSHHYYRSLFSRSKWKSRQATTELQSLEQFADDIAKGQHYLASDLVQKAFCNFGRACDQVQDILAKDKFLLLPYLGLVTLLARGGRGQEVLTRLLDFISRMIHDCFPSLRPLEHIVTDLCTISVQQRGDSATRLIQSSLEQLRGEFSHDGQDYQALHSSMTSLQRHSDLAHKAFSDNELSFAASRVLIFSISLSVSCSSQ